MLSMLPALPPVELMKVNLARVVTFPGPMLPTCGIRRVTKSRRIRSSDVRI
ncbi:hypothetical protein J048_5683 [Klebsiella pneumoniae 120_1020]|nr:hypothetical protein J048_5683 [Klebsiella pneumoniae 120_1020]